MSTRRPSLPRPLLAGLRWLLARDRADALVDDREEELARRLACATPPRWPRVWLVSRVTADCAALVWFSLAVGARSQRHVLRDAWRSLRSTPGTSLFALLILTVGMAGATVTFSVVDAVVLRPFPFESRGLVVVTGPDFRTGTPEYVAWRDGAKCFRELAASEEGLEVLPVGAQNLGIRAAQATPNLFETLRVRPLIGRAFTQADQDTGPERVVVISYSFWRWYFNSDPAVLGRRVPFRGGAATVIGVMPQGFTYPIEASPAQVDLWTPFIVPSNQRPDTVKGGVSRSSGFTVVGRLAAGTSMEQAAAQVDASMDILRRRFSLAYKTWRPQIQTLDESIFGKTRIWMLLVLWAVTLVMAITCVNVANLLLIRSTSRAREYAVRTALGATRGNVMASVLAESLLLSGAAVGLALMLASWGIGVARAALPEGVVRASSIALDLRVVLVVIITGVGTGLFFGSVPAWQAARADVATVLKDASPTGSSRRGWRAALLVAEIAFVGALLIATTLFVTSFVRVVSADLGFDRRNLIAIDHGAAFQGSVDAFSDALRRLPGVVSVAAFTGGSSPLVDAGSAGTTLQRTDAPESEPTMVGLLDVSPEYFHTAGVPILSGHVFSPASTPKPTEVALDTAAARELFGDTNPIGRVVAIPNYAEHITVVAVVASVRTQGPESVVTPMAYFPIDRKTSRFLVRVAAPSAAMLPAIKATAKSLLPPGRELQSLVIVDDAFRALTAGRRFNAGLMAILGAVASLIGAAGIYGVMASVVAQRRRELGIRIALGASAARIRQEILAEAARYVASGLAIGLVAGAWSSRFFASLLFGIKPTDASTYAIAATIVVGVAVVATLPPARRASAVDPIATLRS